MNLKNTAVITLLAATLLGAAQSQAGTVNRGSGGFLSTGLGGGAGGAAANTPQFYTAVLRAPSNSTCPSIIGTARFSSDTNTTTTAARSGYVNLSSGGSQLAGSVQGGFAPSATNVVASYSATNSFFDAISQNALLGDYVVFIGGSIDAEGSTSLMTKANNPYNAVVMNGEVDPNDNTIVVYTTTNVQSDTMSSLVYKK
jgi:hypothetical protein